MSEARLIEASGPVLVFGGCYSNREATEALFRAAARHGIPPERMICTGDIVAYGADPQACVDRLRAAGVQVVMGNCEEQIAADAGDCGCGFAPGSECDRLSQSWYAYARARLDDGARRWMTGLPRRLDLVLGGRRFAVVHGAPSRINRFIFASTPDAILAEEISATGADGVIAGHSGLPFTRGVGAHLWHNAGAIGLPANDGTPRGWYSILTPIAEGVRIDLHPLAYDFHAAAAAMRRAGLPEEYALALEDGLWPNLDILPLAERAATATLLPERPAEPARVALERLETLWFNTGTLCNLACEGCYIESSPRNDRLAYLSLTSFLKVLGEAREHHPELREIGFTGGEPFLNPEIVEMIESAIAGSYRVLLLTNAMTPMQRRLDELRRFRGADLHFRVSLDHFTRAGHEVLRGARSWQPTLAGIALLIETGFRLSIAARFDPDCASEAGIREGFARLFTVQGWPIEAEDPEQLVLFPELQRAAGVPGVSERAWAALHPRGADTMCRTSRMVMQRKGAADVSIAACTLLPYEERFDLGPTLAGAGRAVTLDHPYCAEFCVFGGATCGGGS